MIQYEKVDVLEGIDVNKTSLSKECMLWDYWYFKDVGFKFELHVCNKFRDVLMTAYELKKLQYWMWKELVLGVFCGILVGMKQLVGWIILC